MPRLAGFPERQPFNVWDVVRAKDWPKCFKEGERADLFGTRGPGTRERIRAGRRELCNLQVVSEITSGDMTHVITGWYVRTTVPPGPDRDEIFHHAVATLYVGEKPMRMLSLGELVQRTDRSEIDETTADRVANVEVLARAMYEEHELHTPPGRPTKIGGRQLRTWSDLPALERNRWIAAADVAFRVTKPRPHLIVPVRQCIDVEIDNYTAGSNFETWVHLVGWAVRDVC